MLEEKDDIATLGKNASINGVNIGQANFYHAINTSAIYNEFPRTGVRRLASQEGSMQVPLDSSCEKPRACIVLKLNPKLKGLFERDFVAV